MCGRRPCAAHLPAFVCLLHASTQSLMYVNETTPSVPHTGAYSRVHEQPLVITSISGTFPAAAYSQCPTTHEIHVRLTKPFPLDRVGSELMNCRRVKHRLRSGWDIGRCVLHRLCGCCRRCHRVKRIIRGCLYLWVSVMPTGWPSIIQSTR